MIENVKINKKAQQKKQSLNQKKKKEGRKDALRLIVLLIKRTL